MSPARRLFFIALFQTLALLVMVGVKQYTLDTGISVVLETKPVDPRSLFSGDYVRLNYAISNLRYDQVGGDRDFSPHDAAYVVLQPGKPYWTPVSVHHALPRLAPGQVVIRGEVEYEGHSLWNAQTHASDNVGYLAVRYGIENYYVPEGEGRKLERPPADAKVSLRVAVDGAGNAGIQAVLVNGKEVYVERLW